MWYANYFPPMQIIPPYANYFSPRMKVVFSSFMGLPQGKFFYFDEI